MMKIIKIKEIKIGSFLRKAFLWIAQKAVGLKVRKIINFKNAKKRIFNVKIKPLFSGKFVKRNIKKKVEITPSIKDESPYMKAIKHHNWEIKYILDRCTLYRNLMTVFFVVCVVLFFYIINVAGTIKVVPFVVKVNGLGEILTVQSIKHAPLITEKVIRYHISQFITDSRAVSGDNIVEKQRVDRAYAAISHNLRKGNALTILKNYIETTKPFKINSISTVEVKVIDVYRVSPRTFQASWQQIKRSVNGQVESKTTFTGQFSYVLGRANLVDFKYNPFGIYITNINWTQNMIK